MDDQIPYSGLTARLVCQVLEDTGSAADAQEAAGISAETYAEWIRDQEGFGDMVAAALDYHREVALRSPSALLMDAFQAIKRTLRVTTITTTTIKKKLGPPDASGKPEELGSEIIKKTEEVLPDWKAINALLPKLLEALSDGSGGGLEREPIGGSRQAAHLATQIMESLGQEVQISSPFLAKLGVINSDAAEAAEEESS